MMSSIFALALLAGVSGQPCAFDTPKLMSLDPAEFDQDLHGGWRSVAYVPGCQRAAADLIKRYRRAHGSTSILYWHEGQLRAQSGQVARAIGLLDKSRKPAATDDFGWNPYVDATIAFLRRDRRALIEARQRLVALPRPKNFSPTATLIGSPVKLAWPPNLNVVDGLIACFGKSYQEAYGRCAKPIVVVK